MMSPESAAVFALHVISLLAGVLGNSFILTVNLVEWIRSGRDLGSCDLTLSSLAASNLCLLCVYFAVNTSPTISQAYSTLDPSLAGLFITVYFLRSCCLWFATWFCVYCCVKIVRFTHPFLVRLVAIFLTHVPWVLLASIFFSIVTWLPTILTSDMQPVAKELSHFSAASTSNASVNGSTNNWKRFAKPYTVYIVHVFAVLAVFAVSAIATIITLCRHMKRMGQNEGSFRSPSLDAPLGAVRTITSLLVLYSSVYLLHCLRFSDMFFHGNRLYEISALVVSYTPAICAIILILGTSRLRKALIGTFSFAVCHLIDTV